MSDPYLQPNGTMKNLLGITDAQELKRVEYGLTRDRERELLWGEVQLPQTFDAAHLKSIHHHVFQDVYEWAGFMRFEPVVLEGQRVQLGPFLQKGGDVFLPAPNIAMALEQLKEQIGADPWLERGDRHEFAVGAAKVLGDLNYIHPFREGNGRTQRQFMRDLAERGGHTLDFSVVSMERNIVASQASNRGDLEPLRRMLEEIGDRERVETLREAIRFLENQQIDWNHRYFASAAPGFLHTALLTVQDSRFALLTEGQGRDLKIVVTQPDHLPLTAKLGEEVRFSAPGHEQGQGRNLEL